MHKDARGRCVVQFANRITRSGSAAGSVADCSLRIRVTALAKVTAHAGLARCQEIEFSQSAAPQLRRLRGAGRTRLVVRGAAGFLWCNRCVVKTDAADAS